MKRILLISVFIITRIVSMQSVAHALDGYFVGKNIVYPAWNSSLALKSARILIEPDNGEWDITSTSIYYNYGKTKTFKFGFPRPITKSGSVEIREFKTYLNSRLRKSSQKRAMANSKIPGLKYEKVYLSSIKMTGKKKREIKHTYTIQMDKDSSGLNTLSYILKPAKLWKGKLDTLEIVISNVDTDFLCSIKPEKGYSIQDGSIEWKINNTNPNEDLRVIWHYGIMDWINKSRKALKGVVTSKMIESRLKTGRSYIKTCFTGKDKKGTYKLIRKSAKAKKMIIDMYEQLVNKHPSAGDLSKIFSHRRYIYKYSENYAALAGMYSNYLDSAERKKIESTAKQLKSIAYDSKKYLSDNALILRAYQLMFKLHEETVKEEGIAKWVCRLAGSYASNNMYDKAVNTYSSINKRSKDKADIEKVLNSMANQGRKKFPKEINIKDYLKVNRGVLAVCKPHLKESSDFSKYEFGALLRIAGSYRNTGKYRKAVALYEKVRKGVYYKKASKKVKEKYVDKHLRNSLELAKKQTDPLFTRIIKMTAITGLVFILLLLSGTIGKIHNISRLVYRKLDDISYVIWSALRPVTGFLLKPGLLLMKKFGEDLEELVEYRMSVSFVSFFRKLFGLIGLIIGAFIKNLITTSRFFWSKISNILDNIPAEARNKVRTLFPVPSLAYYAHIFSIFKKTKVEVIEISGEIKRNKRLKGEVLITGDLTIKKGATLTVWPGTTITFQEGPADNDVKIDREGEIITNEGRCDIVVYGKLVADGREGASITIGNKEWGSIIFMGKARDSSLELCEIEGAADAVKCYDSSSPSIKNCVINGSSGFAVKLFDKASPVIESNNIAGSGSGGIICCNESSAKIISNSISNCNEVGIRCTGTSSPRLSGNNIVKGLLTAVECLDSSAPKLFKNIIQESKEYGVLCRDSSMPVLKENTLGNNGVGVYCGDSSEPSIENNMIRGSKYAVDCEESSKPAIRGNTLTSNNVGIELKTTAEPVINSNKLLNSITAGIECGGNMKYIIKGNTFEKNDSGILCSGESSSEVLNNKFNENKTAVSCSDSSKPKVDSNDFNDNQHSIVCLDESAPIISTNRLKGSKKAAIKFINHSTPAISANSFVNNEVVYIKGTLTGAKVEGNNTYKDNSNDEQLFQEEGTPAVQPAPRAEAIIETTAESAGISEAGTGEVAQQPQRIEIESFERDSPQPTQSAPSPGQAQPQAGQAQKAGGAGSLGGIEDLSMNTEDVDGVKKTVITALDSAIGFDLVEETYSDESIDNLDKIGSVIMGFAGYSIEINVHTDNTGNPVYNLSLSKNIAKGIAEYLVNIKKIEAGLITGEGFGGQKPVASNDSEDGRHKNRRVEFILTRK